MTVKVPSSLLTASGSDDGGVQRGAPSLTISPGGRKSVCVRRYLSVAACLSCIAAPTHANRNMLCV